MYKCIIFDFDGTIVDSTNVFLRIGNSLAEKYGVKKITAEEFKALSTLTAKEKCKKLGVPLYKVPKIAVEMLENFYQHTDDLCLIDGIKDTLVKLKEEGFKLGIISSNSMSNIEKFLNSINLNLFDCIYSSPGLFGKHHTINNFLKKMDVARENAIYIGDELRDIVACKKAGVKIISVTWGYDSAELLSNGNPDYIADKPSEILSFVHGI